MSSVTATVKGKPAATQSHATLTLLGKGGSAIILPVTNPAATYDNLAGAWVEIPRPGLPPLNKRVGSNLATLALTVTVVAGDGGTRDPTGTVEACCAALVAMAGENGPGRPIALTWGKFPSTQTVTASGHWNIDSFSLVTTWLQPGTNNISQAVATITLKAASDE